MNSLAGTILYFVVLLFTLISFTVLGYFLGLKEGRKQGIDKMKGEIVDSDRIESDIRRDERRKIANQILRDDE